MITGEGTDEQTNGRTNRGVKGSIYYELKIEETQSTFCRVAYSRPSVQLENLLSYASLAA